MATTQYHELEDRRSLLLALLESSGVPQTAASAAVVIGLGVEEATDAFAALMGAGQIVGACLTCRRGGTSSEAYEVFGEWQLNSAEPHAAVYATADVAARIKAAHP